MVIRRKLPSDTDTARNSATAMPHQITILSHFHQRARTPFYLIDYLARLWEQRNYRVDFHYQIRPLTRDELVFLHVDLSVVPQNYRALVAPHPRVINRDIVDIRKATQSRNRVLAEDDYQGPVIVKTSLNSAGRAEDYAKTHRAVRLARRLLRPLRSHYRSHRSWPAELKPHGMNKYALLNHRDEIPAAVWNDEKWVVERFRPEKCGTQFVLREWFFLGEREYHNCEVSPYPIFTSGTARPDLSAPPPPQVRRWREELQMDFGKIDYAIAENGEPVLYDINKTPTLRKPLTPTGHAIIEALAPSIEAWFDTQG